MAKRRSHTGPTRKELEAKNIRLMAQCSELQNLLNRTNASLAEIKANNSAVVARSLDFRGRVNTDYGGHRTFSIQLTIDPGMMYADPRQASRHLADWVAWQLEKNISKVFGSSCWEFKA